MKVEDIKFIERELQIKLPESYKRIALKGIMANSSAPELIYNDPRIIVQTNNLLRKKGLHGQPWKDNLFVFGYSLGSGSYYFIDSNLENGLIYMANKTKYWRYSSERVENEDITICDNFDMYIACRCEFILFKDERERNPKPPPSPEEMQRMLDELYEETDRICAENAKRMGLDM